MPGLLAGRKTDFESVKTGSKPVPAARFFSRGIMAVPGSLKPMINVRSVAREPICLVAQLDRATPFEGEG